MHGGTSPGAIAGTGNVWRWVASSTDNEGSTYATAKYGAGTGALATHLINYTHPFANDMLLNTTGFFLLGQGSSNINSTLLNSPGTHVAYSPFIVYDKGVYNAAAQTYTQVIARPLTTTPSTNIAQFQPGVVYNFALAVFSGGPNPIPAGVPTPTGWTQMADNSETKSISTWVTMEFTGAPSSTLSVTTPTSTVTQTSTLTNSVVSTTTNISTATVTETSTSTAISTLTSPPSTIVSTSTASASGPSFQLATAATLVALVVGLIAGMIAFGRVSGRKAT